MCVARTISEPWNQAELTGAPAWGVPSPRDWHALDAAVAVSELGAEPKRGLAMSEVAKRRLRYGPNALQKVRSRPAWRLLVDQFASIVIALLAVAAGVAWITGDGIEAIAILIVLLINAFFGFVTEWQAGRALDALRQRTRMATRVRREGTEATVDAEELVPGDIIILNAGVGGQLGHTFNCRSRTRSAFDGLLRNPFILIAAVVVISLQLLAVYFPPLAKVLGTVRPSETDWLVILLCALAPILIVEATKTVTRWKLATKEAQGRGVTQRFGAL